VSSKKARRRERQQREQEERGRRATLSPVALFILGIGAAVLVTIVAAFFLVDRADRGDPPWPGAVWSEPHGHWH
jgi:hypothetical protein